MISGASEEELIEAIGRADVLLEFIPKIKQLQKENKQQKEVIDKAINLIVKETKSMPTNGCKIRLKKLLDILNEVSE